VSVHALVPLKHHGEAKSRLGGLLSVEERIELMEVSTADVIAAISATPGIGRITVVSSGRAKRDLAARLRVGYFDDRDLAWNDALLAAMREAVSEPCVAIVSADIPLVRPAELEQLVAATPARGVAIGRALDAGTNALCLRPPAAMRTCFGEKGSAHLHAELAERADLEPVLVDLPGIALDLDLPQDVERLLATAPVAAHTRLLLERLVSAGRSDAR
jgi:2-phospho-L-lactate guanylyltransferase